MKKLMLFLLARFGKDLGINLKNRLIAFDLTECLRCKNEEGNKIETNPGVHSGFS